MGNTSWTAKNEAKKIIGETHSGNEVWRWSAVGENARLIVTNSSDPSLVNAVVRFYKETYKKHQDTYDCSLGITIYEQARNEIEDCPDGRYDACRLILSAAHAKHRSFYDEKESSPPSESEQERETKEQLAVAFKVRMQVIKEPIDPFDISAKMAYNMIKETTPDNENERKIAVGKNAKLAAKHAYFANFVNQLDRHCMGPVIVQENHDRHLGDSIYKSAEKELMEKRSGGKFCVLMACAAVANPEMFGYDQFRQIDYSMISVETK